MQRTNRAGRRGAAWVALVIVLVSAGAGAGAATAGDGEAGAKRLAQRGRAFEAEGKLRHAAEAYRAALRRAPRLAGVYRRLVELHERLGPAGAAAQRKRLARLFDEGTYLEQTRHYLIVYDGRHQWVEARAKLLEQAHDNFYRKLRRAGFRPLPLARRLEVVLFRRHGDFRDYTDARRHEAGEWSAGYYTAGSNRVVMFNFHTSPQLNELVQRIDALRREIDNLKAVGRVRPGRHRQLAHARRQLGQTRQRYHTIAAWGNIRQTLHEAAHQLAYNSGIQRRGVQYPMWFSEGLATSFETAHPAAPFGPSQVNGNRLHGVFEARRRGDLLPLKQLISLAKPPDQEHPRNASYSQAWALFHFLFNERTAQLRRYVDHMADQPPGKRDPAAHRDDFERCFGPVEQVERAWRDHLRRMLR